MHSTVIEPLFLHVVYKPNFISNRICISNKISHILRVIYYTSDVSNHAFLLILTILFWAMICGDGGILEEEVHPYLN